MFYLYFLQNVVLGLSKIMYAVKILFIYFTYFTFTLFLLILLLLKYKT